MKLLDFLLKYQDLILIVFTFIIGFKSLDTIKKYQSKKAIDLEYQTKFDLIQHTNKQLHEFILVASKTQSLFKAFNSKYTNFENNKLNNNKFDDLKARLSILENSYIELDQILFKNYLLDSELIEVGRLYRFAISEYLYEYLKILEHLEKNDISPSEINLNDEYFKNLTIFYDDTSSVIFDLFQRIEERIEEIKTGLANWVCLKSNWDKLIKLISTTFQ